MNLQTKKNHFNEAFTLIELMLYVALVSIVISGMISFAWIVIGISMRNRTMRQVTDNGRFISKKIQYYVRNADDINLLSLNQICLSYTAQPDMDPLSIYLEDEKVFLGWGGTSDCSTLTNTEVMNDPNLYIDTLFFQDLSSGTGASKNISFDLIVSSRADRDEWNNSQNFSSSIELRSN